MSKKPAMLNISVAKLPTMGVRHSFCLGCWGCSTRSFGYRGAKAAPRGCLGGRWGLSARAASPWRLRGRWLACGWGVPTSFWSLCHGIVFSRGIACRRRCIPKTGFILPSPIKRWSMTVPMVTAVQALAFLRAAAFMSMLAPVNRMPMPPTEMSASRDICEVVTAFSFGAIPSYVTQYRESRHR